MVNFGKNYKNEVIKEWENYYFDYNEIKKITNRKELGNSQDINSQLKVNDERVLSEIDKINKFYTEKIEILEEKFNNFSDDDDISYIFKECDKLRHFMLLNTITVIKTIKRRNKRTPNTVNIEDFISKCKFYNSDRLNSIYSKLSEILQKKKLEVIDAIMKENSMMFSFITLKRIREQTTFQDYKFLPNYTSDYQNDINLVDYLNNKLGPNNSITIIEVNDNISLRDLDNRVISKRRKILYSISVPFLLYAFLFGLDLMSNSFKILSGKGMNLLFSSITNPIAGVMIGIIATVLLQSSSTTTSIVVAMTGSNIIDVKTAIPIIMGANIGTSVTNTLVSHAHIRNVNEFKLAFAGATVHDMFNYLSVIILLPIEVISGALGYDLLYKISENITNLFVGTQTSKFESPIKVILKPFTKLFVSVDKNIIKGIANGCVSCNSTVSSHCWDLKMTNCLTRAKWDEKYLNGKIIKSGVLKNLGDQGGGILGLIISLVVLCLALYLIVKVLHTLVLSSNGRGRIMRLVQRSLNLSPYITMLLGMFLTIAVQSSSIITSTFTPLVGLSILTVEQMYPLTLGSNIGTTCTAILASLVTESTNSIQIAICHFIFNIIGIMIWFPIPITRKVPLKMANRLGDLVSRYRWFGMFYILYLFVLIPGVSWGISNLISLNTIGLVFGIIMLLIICILTLLLFSRFEKVVNFFNNCYSYQRIHQIQSTEIEMTDQ